MVHLLAALVLASQVSTSLELVGVLLADEPGARAAVLRDRRTGHSVTVRPDDQVAGRRVVHISAGRVLVEGADGLAAISSPAAWIETAGCDSTAFDAFARSSDLAGQARIVPAFVNGSAIGFRLFSIRPGSPLERAGLKNGDVVARINGEDLTSPDKALRLYASLRCARRFEVELVRRGERIQLIVLLV